MDLSRLAFSALDEDYTGLELVGDYRLTHRLYLAVEVGAEQKTQTEDLDGILLYRFTTDGSYLKAGLEVNTYTNWLSMQNAITFGGRYAVAYFNQTLEDYTIFETNDFYNDTFIQGAEPGQEFNDRVASWLEFVAGIKVELFANLYVGITARLGFLVTNEEEDFPNLWIPGFNKVTDDSNFGVGFNYTLSYLLPFYKKATVKKEAP